MFLLLVSAAIALAATSPRPKARGVASTLRTIAHDRQVLRFFSAHAWLFQDPRFESEARRQVAAHRRSLATAEHRLARLRQAAEARRRRTVRRLALSHPETPAHVVCRVFGSQYCSQAVRVAQCESGLEVGARNGQYLGLFQMGSMERHLFGHGPTAEEQAQAAYRYFVWSGRDWSPWSCKP
jgi:hypothetical protein